jgi:hypothetical protein
MPTRRCDFTEQYNITISSEYTYLKIFLYTNKLEEKIKLKALLNAFNLKHDVYSVSY